MKTLRTICYVCAGYYLVQMLGFFLASSFMRMIRPIRHTAVLEHNPVYQMEMGRMQLMQSYAPYVLIGVVVSFAMALWMRPLWKAIPVMALLLLGGGILWMISFAKKAQAFIDVESAGLFPYPDKGFGRFLNATLSAANWASATPILIPGILIFIFWRKAEMKERAARLKAAGSAA